MPIQLDFILRRLVEMAEKDVSPRRRQPWQAAYERDYAWLGGMVTKHYRGDDSDVKLLLVALDEAFGGMTLDAYQSQVLAFFEVAAHLTLGRPYRRCAFKPMVELLRYLEANRFETYIASAGDGTSCIRWRRRSRGSPPTG